MMQLAPLEPWILEGARELFDTEIARPQSLTVNVMGPMAAGHRHVDVPSYRGFSQKKVPIWFSTVMGVSGLFDRWAIRVAGALTWCYDGSDGEYEYWPRGVDHPSECERAPFGNVALFGDNDLMFHQVGAIGDAHQFDEHLRISAASEIRPAANGWEITDGGDVIGTLPNEQVRISLLWRAVTFRLNVFL
jgi:hypothetical protein